MATVAQLEQALRASQQEAARYRQLLDHSGEVSWMIDCASGELTWLSQAALSQFGYTLETARPLAWDLAQELAPRLERYESGDLSRRRVLREIELPHADGHPVPVAIESTLMLDADGVPVSVLGVVRDLRERRALADQQKKFASMLSHEFRTPLSTIDGAVQRLEMTGTHHDEGTRKRYRKIQTAVDRMLAMLDEYLSPERMASIGRARQPDEISPANLLESVADAARARRARVDLHIGALPQWMRCDPAGIRLCLDILIDNAIKYTPADTPLALSGRMAPEGGVEFLVGDQGAGVPEAELDTIFGRGTRGANAAGVAGSGLGLYMARSIADVHGGTVSVRNVSESGAEFRIWLPAAAKPGKSLARVGSNSDNSSDTG
ncbi:PAS domain-containing sensor histidine kinase [Duganella sp. Leaf126]|uniref:PAS domain-containing sensor histidine kinase n=1 Tax=Duganella sp. Leaf126 TaxID=1736266 RepID=UPI0006F81868|nr:PAS domain-containing sensor histidine kinase [Duganella sp. Leaf126]KQQ31001.1 PAS domain-containing sensor histidine kinase [Duganella sp. Leaf126]